jgi:hypothetical protein
MNMFWHEVEDITHMYLQHSIQAVHLPATQRTARGTCNNTAQDLVLATQHMARDTLNTAQHWYQVHTHVQSGRYLV